MGAYEYCGQEVPSSLTSFTRGDTNLDDKVNFADAIFVISFHFFGGREADCMKSADANDDGKVDIADAIYILSYQFSAGPNPKPPFPECGIDTTPEGDDLSCESYHHCF